LKAERASGRKAARRIVGLDFSGAVAAGKAIWIAEGHEARGLLVLESCRPALELPGSGAMRGTALPAVVRHLASLGDAIVGCDFPFGLPREVMGSADWRGFLNAFPARFRSAEAFRDSCRAATGGRELRRLCDVEAKVPFCAWNLRLYRQTWHGIAEILRPLVLEHDARVLPMEAALPDRLWLTEVCPASFLKRIRLYEPYKGRGAHHRAMRAGMLARLVADKLLAPLAPSLERRLLDDPGGDALDSVIAAVATWRNWRDGVFTEGPRSTVEALEGRVYF
jgi:hypothetical protein